MSIALAVLLGIGIGLGFFGSLHWIVDRLHRLRAPALWLAASSAIRIGLVVLAFYLIGRGSWPRLVAALVGFVLGRTIALRRWGRGPG